MDNQKDAMTIRDPLCPVTSTLGRELTTASFGEVTQTQDARFIVDRVGGQPCVSARFTTASEGR